MRLCLKTKLKKNIKGERAPVPTAVTYFLFANPPADLAPVPSQPVFHTWKPDTGLCFVLSRSIPCKQGTLEI